IECFGYRIEQKPLPGTLQIERAVNLGVPKGPLLRDLKNGLDVTLEDGSVVKSTDVVEAEKKGFTVTVLGDTRYCEAAISLSQNADIVIHEATFDAVNRQLAHDYGHATNVEAATVAKLAGAQNVLLTHISARFTEADVKLLLTEAKEVFENSYIVHDLQRYDWKNNELHLQLPEK
ncbi:MAG: MBL fold metallo-hydrolase, partial [Lysinibacillus sp.]